MTRNTPSAGHTRRGKVFTLITGIVAGAAGGAVRALTTWLLDH
ncbi:hypothetical protein SUDANB176_06874 [Streptomyces sp. enrichment culture]